MRKFFGDIVSELKKVTWPTREETTRLTVAVVIVAVAIGLLLGGVDIGFNWLVDNTAPEVGTHGPQRQSRRTGRSRR